MVETVGDFDEHGLIEPRPRVQPGGAEIEVLNICLSPHGHKHFIAHEHLPILERRHHLSDSIPPDLSNRLSPAVVTACLLKALHKRAYEFRIEKLKGAISPIDDGDLHAERGKD